MSRTGAPVHRARKRFGQHFLTDLGVIDAIIGAVDPRPGQCVVEIGPGLGALTEPLLRRVRALTVVELDRDLAQRLRQRPGLNVVEADVLRVDFSALAETAQAPLRVVGNLPYNISSPILFHLLNHVACIQDQHFMLQKEVIDRMLAPCGHSAYGRLSVMLQWRYAMHRVVDVGPASFDPPPRVDSAVVAMHPLAQAPAVNVAVLSEVVQAAFSQRRKLLRHSLEPWLLQRGWQGQFDMQRRAQEVSVAEYVALAQTLGPAAPTDQGAVQ